MKKFILVLMASACLMAADGYRKTLAFNPGQTLEIDLPAGNVTIQGTEKHELGIYYEYNKYNQDFVLSDEITAKGVKLIGSKPSRQKRFKLHLRLEVPRQLNVLLRTKGGNLAFNDLVGEIDGKTHGGNVSMSGLDCDVRLKTMGGNINVDNSLLDGSVETMGGNINLSKTQGLVDCKTMGGNINLDNEGTTSQARPLNVTTMGGNINVGMAPGGISAETYGGNVSVKSVTGDADLSTKGGNISVDEMRGAIKAETMGGKITVAVFGEGGDITLESMGGDIELFLPESFSASFDLEIDKGRRYDKEPEIMSDFPVNTLKKNSETVQAAGTVNGGQYKVRLRTVNSDILIHKQ